MQLAKRSWDAAAARCAASASTSATELIALAAAQPDAQALEALPELPDIAGGLSQLQGLAALCADQLSGAVQRADRLVKQCAVGQQQLAAAAHKAAFKGLPDVQRPQNLLRAVAAL